MQFDSIAQRLSIKYRRVKKFSVEKLSRKLITKRIDIENSNLTYLLYPSKNIFILFQIGIGGFKVEKSTTPFSLR